MLTKLHRTLLDRVSALNSEGLLRAGELSQVTELAFYVLFGVGATAGQVVIETAHDPAFTGTWATPQTVDWVAANRVHHVAMTAEHLTLRARISTAIAGGVVTVIVIGS